MADKKIMQLDETQDLDGFYVPGSKEVSGVYSSKKFNLGSFKESINNISNYITYGIEEFSDQKNYYTGEYVMYDNNIYRFITYHQAGLWNPGDVTTPSNVFSELTYVYSYPQSYETVNINITSNSEIAGFNSGIQVTLVLSNNIELQETSNSSGICTFKVPVGLEYTIKMPEKAGYDSIGDATYIAENISRSIDIMYQKISTQKETCDIDICFTTNIGEPFISENFEGKKCFLIRDYEIVGNTIVTNGVASFTGLEKGVSYTTILPPTIDNYIKPAEKTFIASESQNNINVVYKYNNDNTTIEIDRQGYGKYLVYEENGFYKEILIDNLFSDNKVTKDGTWIGDELGITKDNAIAFHIYDGDLATRGYDFYILIKTIKTEDGFYASNKTYPWSPSIVQFPNVPIATSGISVANGRLNTYYMCYDSKITLNQQYPNLSSPAAEWALAKTFEYKGRNNTQTLRGFIGSPTQMNKVYYNSNKSDTPSSIGIVLHNLGLISGYTYAKQHLTSNQVKVSADTSKYIYYFNLNVYYNLSKDNNTGVLILPIFSF